MDFKTIKKRDRNKIVIFFVMSLAFFFCLGFMAKCYFFMKKDEFITSEKREAKTSGVEFKYINPLLECDIAQFTMNKNMTKVRVEIEDSIEKEISKKHISSASVYYRDLNNGPWFGINEKADFAPASLLKVPLMMAYFYDAEKDPSILTREITIQEDYAYLEQNIVPESKLEKDKSYTIEDLIERMIVYSDNYAYTLLLENIEIISINKVFDDMGINSEELTNSKIDDILSVKNYAAFFRVLFNSSYLSRAYSEKALSILIKTKFERGLISGTPKNIEIAHKFGERKFADTEEVQLHDCGIVYLPEKPYLLCIMTRGNDINELSRFISDTSKKVYEYVNLNKEELE